jgi:hypothetical protein
MHSEATKRRMQKQIWAKDIEEDLRICRLFLLIDEEDVK